MMLGETLCFGGYFIMKYIINRKDPEAFDGNAKPVNPLLMLPVKRSVYYYYVVLCMHKCVGWNDIHIIHNHTRLDYFIWFSTDIIM